VAPGGNGVSLSAPAGAAQGKRHWSHGWYPGGKRGLAPDPGPQVGAPRAAPSLGAQTPRPAPSWGRSALRGVTDPSLG
uniref:Uncharacterized protein n=1 Tax=Nothoprocta perdicaria TaxID=30464 RepID=A0A8C6Z348_NOTPE